jgi:hypothetical protein
MKLVFILQVGKPAIMTKVNLLVTGTNETQDTIGRPQKVCSYLLSMDPGAPGIYKEGLCLPACSHLSFSPSPP